MKITTVCGDIDPSELGLQIPHSHFVFLENSAHPMMEDNDLMVEKSCEFLAG
jgi:predicted metal-dependent phosphotriesterase family hydrolase